LFACLVLRQFYSEALLADSADLRDAAAVASAQFDRRDTIYKRRDEFLEWVTVTTRVGSRRW
jgi:hypothetical protein